MDLLGVLPVSGRIMAFWLSIIDLVVAVTVAGRLFRMPKELKEATLFLQTVVGITWLAGAVSLGLSAMCFLFGVCQGVVFSMNSFPAIWLTVASAACWGNVGFIVVRWLLKPIATRFVKVGKRVDTRWRFLINWAIHIFVPAFAFVAGALLFLWLHTPILI